MFQILAASLTCSPWKVICWFQC